MKSSTLPLLEVATLVVVLVGCFVALVPNSEQYFLWPFQQQQPGSVVLPIDLAEIESDPAMSIESLPNQVANESELRPPERLATLDPNISANNDLVAQSSESMESWDEDSFDSLEFSDDNSEPFDLPEENEVADLSTDAPEIADQEFEGDDFSIQPLSSGEELSGGASATQVRAEFRYSNPEFGWSKNPLFDNKEERVVKPLPSPNRAVSNQKIVNRFFLDDYSTDSQESKPRMTPDNQIEELPQLPNISPVDSIEIPTRRPMSADSMLRNNDFIRK